MPRRKTFARKRPYARHRRYRKKNNYTTVVQRGLGPVAPRTITTLKYCDSKGVTLAAGAMTDIIFNMNSLWDPDAALGGHQPYGFDQLATLYLRYRVFECKWIVSIPSSNDRMEWTVVPVNGSVTFSSTADVITAGEMPKAIRKVTSYGGGGAGAIFKGKQYLPKLGGDKRVEYKTDDRFEAIVTTSPSEVMQLHIVGYNPSAASVTTDVQITIAYVTEFFDVLKLPGST